MVQFFMPTTSSLLPKTPVDTCNTWKDAVYSMSVWKYCTQTTQNHTDAPPNFAPLRKKHMSLCSSVKNHFTLTDWHRICSAVFGHKNIRTYFIFTQKYRIWPNKFASFFAYFEKSVGAIEFCLLGRGCGFVNPHPQKTTFNLERKSNMKGCASKYQYRLLKTI